MSEGMLRFVFLAGLVFLGGVALFVGAVVTGSALSNGVIDYSYGAGSHAVRHTVTRAGDPEGFWRGVGLLGGLPMLLGALSIWWGRREMLR